jgi:hypothetical protein
MGQSRTPISLENGAIAFIKKSRRELTPVETGRAQVAILDGDGLDIDPAVGSGLFRELALLGLGADDILENRAPI